MKTLFILSIVLSCIPFHLLAQSQQNVAMNQMLPEEVIYMPSKKFVYEIYDSITSPQILFEEEHFLGGNLTRKWNTFNYNYTRIFDVKAGFSGSAVEIQKPSIYNAVIKVNNYYKKAYKKGLLDKAEIESKLSHILDCANVIYFEDTNDEFENAIKSAKSILDIIHMFDDVTIKLIRY